jgi:hypothetical protein
LFDLVRRALQGVFVFRVKMGDYEVELSGTREEVLKTVEELPALLGNVRKAFDGAKPKTVTTLTVKTEPTKQESQSQKFPKIPSTENSEDAVISILRTDWGKWRPRTIDELKEALQANGMGFPGRVLANALNGLVKKSRIRRWSTDSGFVYILVEDEALKVRGEVD